MKKRIECAMHILAEKKVLASAGKEAGQNGK